MYESLSIYEQRHLSSVTPPGGSGAPRSPAEGLAGACRWACCTWGRRCEFPATSPDTLAGDKVKRGEMGLLCSSYRLKCFSALLPRHEMTGCNYRKFLNNKKSDRCYSGLMLIFKLQCLDSLICGSCFRASNGILCVRNLHA